MVCSTQEAENLLKKTESKTIHNVDIKVSKSFRINYALRGKGHVKLILLMAISVRLMQLERK